MRTRLLVVAAIEVAAAVACSPETTKPVPPPAPPPALPPPLPPPPPQPPPPPPPGSGTVSVTFTTPRTDDGAILFELRGPSIHAVTPASTNLQFHIDSSGSPIRGVALGVINSGVLLTFTISDTTAISSYSATIVDVADRQNALRSTLAGYALRITH